MQLSWPFELVHHKSTQSSQLTFPQSSAKTIERPKTITFQDFKKQLILWRMATRPPFPCHSEAPFFHRETRQTFSLLFYSIQLCPYPTYLNNHFIYFVLCNLIDHRQGIIMYFPLFVPQIDLLSLRFIMAGMCFRSAWRSIASLLWRGYFWLHRLPVQDPSAA